MYGVSEDFLRLLRRSHTARSRVEVYHDDLEEPYALTLLDGGVTTDINDNVRRSMRATVVDEGGIFDPSDMLDLLSPFTTKLKVYRGILIDGVYEDIPCGTFKPESVEASEDDQGAVTVEVAALDLSSRVQFPMPRPKAFRGGTKLEDAVAQLIADRMRNVKMVLPTTGMTIPPLLIREESDAWQEASSLALAGGYDLAFNRDEAVEMTSRDVLASRDFVWDFVEGENADFWEPARRASIDAYPNVVVVTGSNSALSAPIRAEVADLDPTSSTYRHGPYGEVVRTYRSEKINSVNQALSMAKNLLARKLGPSEEMTFSAVPNPALDEGDTVRITRERLGVYRRRMMVVNIEMPFRAEDEMTVTVHRSVWTGEEGMVGFGPGSV